MLIGVPKEIKTHEYRVGMTPPAVREAVRHGHRVMIEMGAGAAIGLSDQAYQDAGAILADSAVKIFAESDMVVKVKEPQPSEFGQLRADQILFTYLHLAPDPEQADALQESGCTAIAYETVTDASGGLPLLTPMSEVAGRMSIQAGAHALELAQGGRGTLLGGVSGVAPAKIVILGGGVVGSNAARMAIGLGADVTVIDRSITRLRQLEEIYAPKLTTIYATTDAIEYYVLGADLVIGAVLVPGAASPKLVTREMVGRMQPGSVLVDVAIDQGGCFETSRPTTHADPIYAVDDVLHYCVANIPGAVARTSTFALNNATLPFILALADKGWVRALQEDRYLRDGLNVHAGRITHQAVAEGLDRAFEPAERVLM